MRAMGSFMMAAESHTVILVVEDESMVRLFIVGQLREHGYLFSKRELVRKPSLYWRPNTCRRSAPYSTDIQLGGKISGWDVAEAFREANPKIQVIYASGQCQDGERRVSGSTFFSKPYRPVTSATPSTPLLPKFAPGKCGYAINVPGIPHFYFWSTTNIVFSGLNRYVF